MVADLLSRVACHRGGDEPLGMSLKRITEVGAVDMTQRRLQELLAPIIEASHEADCRRKIMRHLCDCLSEPTGKRWQRIYGALVLTEKLVQQGSPVLLIETAHGYHFDIVQKVSFLEHFDSEARGCTDRRAQHTIRKKAAELRLMLIPQLRAASTKEVPESVKETASTCSPGGISSTPSTIAGCSLKSVASLDSLPEPGTPERNTSLPHDGGSNKLSRDLTTAPGFAERDPELMDDLRRITESELSDIPLEFFAPIISASHHPCGRQAITSHLHFCLVAPEARHWRRVYGGLLIAEALMQHDSSLVFTQPTPGVNLDLPKQIWFLEQFEYRSNWRAQNMVRKKAIELREKMVPWLLNRGMEEPCNQTCDHIDEAFSTLRTWAESAELMGSSGGLSSEPPPFEESVAGDDCMEGQGEEAADTRTLPVGEQEDNDSTSEVFFTPAQTPAVGLAKVRATHLISL